MGKNKSFIVDAVVKNYDFLCSAGVFGMTSPSTKPIDIGKKTYELKCQKIVHKSNTCNKMKIQSLSIELLFRPKECVDVEKHYANLSPIQCYKLLVSQIEYIKNNINKIKTWEISNGYTIESIFFNIECSCLPHIIEDIVELSVKLKSHRMNLVLELTERENYYDENTIKRCIYHLKDYGINVAIDDLLNISDHRYGIINLVDYIKVICPSNLNSENSEQFMMLTFHIKEKYKKNIIVEKVENQAQYDFLSTTPFDFIQGYYFDTPSCIDDSIFL